MLNRLIDFLLNPPNHRLHADERHDDQMLDGLASAKNTSITIAPLSPAEQSGNRPEEITNHSIVCREAMLDREQRVTGYEFMLRSGIRDRVHTKNQRIIHHVYTEVVIRTLLQFSIHKLLDHRQAFITVIDSFLASPLIEQLPGLDMVLTVMPVSDADRPALDPLVERIRELKKRGFKFALEQCFEAVYFEKLATYVDYFIFRTPHHNPAYLKKAAEHLGQHYKAARLVARELESFDDFELCRKLGFALFQGPFVTSREDWTGNQMQPQTLYICDLLNHLRRDADTTELVQILKQDAALLYRLLRYINSAAIGLRQTITSIEHALVLMGRQKMYRWLTLLLLCSTQNSPHAAALHGVDRRAGVC